MMVRLGGIAEHPVRSILRGVADAAERWSDADFPPRVRALGAIGARTGYSEPVVEYALDRLFGSLTYEALQSTIVDELGSLDALDRFVASAGGMRRRAVPGGPVCVVSSRTTIGVAIVPAVFALCAKCNVLVKDREDRLAGAFFATLGEERDALRDAARAERWEGERDLVDLGAFANVVVFGTDATIAEIRRNLPVSTNAIAFGSKASAGYIAREALAGEASVAAIVEGAARDLVLYDTEGCLSLHALFVERGGAISPEGVAERLALALQRASVEFPLGSRAPEAIARLAAARDLAAFRTSNGAPPAYADASLGYLVVVDPPAKEPPAFLPRALAVRAVDEPADAVAYLGRHAIPIEALAVAGNRDDIAAAAIALGAARIARFGNLQSPPLQGRHGGRPRIAEFVRWIVDET